MYDTSEWMDNKYLVEKVVNLLCMKEDICHIEGETCVSQKFMGVITRLTGICPSNEEYCEVHDFAWYVPPISYVTDSNKSTI